jgi:multidrug efflux pump subunit AcrB
MSSETNLDRIESILELSVSNKDGYLVPLSQLVDIQKVDKPTSISRVNFKRTITIYADLNDQSRTTPLEIAANIETNIFPKINDQFPSANLIFRGEVQDSRESQGDFKVSLIMVLVLILLLLIFLFNSLTAPLLILSVVPFGVVGVIIAFWAHGFSAFGFFAVVGTLGMIGVVINDSIVLINKFQMELTGAKLAIADIIPRIVEITTSRLRAVVVTTLTTVTGLLPTAYGWGGFDSMLAEMMLAMAWGLLFGMVITLILVPTLYTLYLKTAKVVQS